MPYKEVDSKSGGGFLLFLLLGIVLLIASGIDAANAVHFAQNGAPVTARITECFSSPKRNNGQTCHYEFQVQGKSYWGSVEGRQYSEGQNIAVTYLKNDPETSALHPTTWIPVGLMLLVLGLASLGASLKLFLSNDDLLSD